MKIRREVQAVIFRKKKDRIEFLLEKKLNYETNVYKWRLLKGGINKGETEQDALRREIYEELKLENIEILRKIGNYSYHAYRKGHQVSPFLVRVSSKEPISCQFYEIEDCIWLPKEKAIRKLYVGNERKMIQQTAKILNL